MIVAQLRDTLTNISGDCKVTYIGIEYQRYCEFRDVPGSFEFDTFEVTGLREGWITQLKLYTIKNMQLYKL